MLDVFEGRYLKIYWKIRLPIILVREGILIVSVGNNNQIWLVNNKIIQRTTLTTIIFWSPIQVQIFHKWCYPTLGIFRLSSLFSKLWTKVPNPPFFPPVFLVWARGDIYCLQGSTLFPSLKSSVELNIIKVSIINPTLVPVSHGN